MSHILPGAFFRWCMSTDLSQLIRGSRWGFAVLETIHILGFGVLLGGICLVDLSVLGFGMRQPAGRIVRDATRWGLAGLAVAAVTGIPMFMSAAALYANSIPFLVKMIMLIASVVLQIVLYKFPALLNGSTAGKVMAAASLLCWFGIAYTGRAIAFEILIGIGIGS
jgi:hypothetical protein